MRAYKLLTQHEPGPLSVVGLAAWLVDGGWTVHVRTALGGGRGQDRFHNLHHQFLVVEDEGEEELAGEEPLIYIVEASPAAPPPTHPTTEQPACMHACGTDGCVSLALRCPAGCAALEQRWGGRGGCALCS